MHLNLKKRCRPPKGNTAVTVWTCHAVGSFGPRTSLFRNKCTNAASFAINLSHFILIKTSCKDIMELRYSYTGGFSELIRRESTITLNYSIETPFINVIVCFQFICDKRSTPLRKRY